MLSQTDKVFSFRIFDRKMEISDHWFNWTATKTKPGKFYREIHERREKQKDEVISRSFFAKATEDRGERGGKKTELFAWFNRIQKGNK